MDLLLLYLVETRKGYPWSIKHAHPPSREHHLQLEATPAINDNVQK